MFFSDSQRGVLPGSCGSMVHFRSNILQYCTQVLLDTSPGQRRAGHAGEAVVLLENDLTRLAKTFVCTLFSHIRIV